VQLYWQRVRYRSDDGFGRIRCLKSDIASRNVVTFRVVVGQIGNGQFKKWGRNLNLGSVLIFCSPDWSFVNGIAEYTQSIAYSFLLKHT
jgi:hypothetical protein